jgi:hypothetical protein
VSKDPASLNAVLIEVGVERAAREAVVSIERVYKDATPAKQDSRAR